MNGNKNRHMIKVMGAIRFSTFKNKPENMNKAVCCCCGKPINIGDKYYYAKYKHGKYNRMYCLECAIEKNCVVIE